MKKKPLFSKIIEILIIQIPFNLLSQSNKIQPIERVTTLGWIKYFNFSWAFYTISV